MSIFIIIIITVANGYHYHYTLHQLETFRFEDEND